MRPPHRPGSSVLRVVVACGLAVDAYVHADLAPFYSGGGGAVSQQNLFLLEAGVAVAGALLVLAVESRWVDLATLVIAASALTAVLTYRYVDLGSLGPLPDMYEPVWFPEKAVSAVAEATAMVAAAVLQIRHPAGGAG